MKSRPKVLKWPGSKTSLAPEIVKHFPQLGETFSYCEGFFGGGGTFFYLAENDLLNGASCLLMDANARLIHLWNNVMNGYVLLSKSLAIIDSKGRSSEEFKKQKLFWNTSRETQSTPARMVWLNHCCFNGLWRENQKGEFNAPIGTTNWRLDSIQSEIGRVGRLLNEIDPVFRIGSFLEVEPKWLEGDRRWCFYLDPPYLYPSGTKGFTEYCGKLRFGLEEHLALAALCRELAERGHRIVVSGADNDWTHAVYVGFEKHATAANSSMAAEGYARGSRKELILTLGPTR